MAVATPEVEAAVEDTPDLQSFDMVWQTIADKHWDLDRDGLDWKAVRDELRPKVVASKSSEEARAVIQDLLSRLGQSHFGIIPAQAYESISPSESTEAVSDEKAAACGGDKRGESGLDLRILDGKAVITSILPGSGAEKAKISLGAIVHEVNGTKVSEVLAPLAKHYEGKLLGPSTMSRSVLRLLDGSEGCPITIVMQGKGDGQETVSLVLQQPQGEPVDFVNIPGLYVRYESTILNRKVGYLSLSSFFNPQSVMEKFIADIKRFNAKKTKGLIIDLRGNPGGVGAMAMGMSGWLINEKGKKLGTLITKDSKMNFLVSPQVSPYAGKVAVLVDGSSLSTSEILAGGLQDLRRARIFGTQTGGAALPSIIVRLPNGDGFQFAFANYISASGKALEAAGVVPDEAVSHTREALLDGKDLALLAALRWIQE